MIECKVPVICYVLQIINYRAIIDIHGNELNSNSNLTEYVNDGDVGADGISSSSLLLLFFFFFCVVVLLLIALTSSSVNEVIEFFDTTTLS